jgi:hypothetical protein
MENSQYFIDLDIDDFRNSLNLKNFLDYYLLIVNHSFKFTFFVFFLTPYFYLLFFSLNEKSLISLFNVINLFDRMHIRLIQLFSFFFDCYFSTLL